MSSTIEAFNIGAGSSANTLSTLLIALVFGSLLIVIAYIIPKLFEELRKGKLEMQKFLLILARISVFVSILIYFLLR